MCPLSLLCVRVAVSILNVEFDMSEGVKNNRFWDSIIWYYCVKYGFSNYCKFCLVNPDPDQAFSEHLLDHKLIHIFIPPLCQLIAFSYYPLSHKSHRHRYTASVSILSSSFTSGLETRQSCVSHGNVSMIFACICWPSFMLTTQSFIDSASVHLNIVCAQTSLFLKRQMHWQVFFFHFLIRL